MKCPICDSEIRDTNDNKHRCIRCGFDDIRTEFINDEERIFWETYVVYPCKYAYRLNKTLQMEVSSLRREFKKVSSSTADSRGVDSIDSTNTTPSKTKITMIDGWNHNDALAHPNGARCKHMLYETRMELTDISTQIDRARNATISFVAKRVKDAPEKKQYSNLADEKTVGFCWRLKDNRGIIVLTGEWENDNLLIGDAIADKIELTNVPDGYSIDFVDHS